jgi:hypothetical protein
VEPVEQGNEEERDEPQTGLQEGGMFSPKKPELIDDQNAEEHQARFLGKTGQKIAHDRPQIPKPLEPPGFSLLDGIGQKPGEHEQCGQEVGAAKEGDYAFGMSRMKGEKGPGQKTGLPALAHAPGKQSDEKDAEEVEDEIGQVIANGIQPPETIVQGQGEGHERTLTRHRINHPLLHRP